MAYVSLYRKYRPQTFDDVVGQEHVTTTLQNAIRAGRVANGYLFSGTRGTAKTTCARILAKALNCVGPDGTLTAATPTPCGVCGPCRAIAASSFVDVREQDAASHGKVDDVRDIVESIAFPPMEGRTKVYIIDEAHQLSRDAMDAFLKTLEEPPPQVVFILATTEQDKLPITIASRCQTFEFKRGSVSQISARLRDVLAQEGVTMDAAALLLVARAADGSYRDSLSLLEQVLAFKRTDITARDVALVLGAVDEDVLDSVVNLIADGDAAGVLALAGDVLEAGRDVRQFLQSLSARLRDLLYLGVGAHPEGEAENQARLHGQAERFSPAALLEALQVLTETEQDVRRTTQGRLLLEMALLRMVRLPTAPTLPDGQRSVASGSRKAAKDAPAPVAKNGTHAPAAPEAPRPPLVEEKKAPPAPQFWGEETILTVSTSQIPTGHVQSTDSALELPPPKLGGPGGPDDETDLADDDAPDDEDIAEDIPLPGDDEDPDALPHPGADDPEELAESRIVTSAADLLDMGGLGIADTDDGFMQVQQVTASLPAAGAAALEAHVQRHAPPTEDTPPELVQLQKEWQQVINRMSSKPPTLPLIKDARPIALQGHTFLLQFTQSVWLDKLGASERGRQFVEDAINRTLKAEPGTYKVRGVLQGSAAAGDKSARPAAPTAAPQHEPSPLLDEVIAVFGGRVIDEK